MDTQTRWTGPIVGKWLDLNRFSVDPPQGAENFVWHDSKQDGNRRPSELVKYSYARDGDRNWWRREEIFTGVGYRRVRNIPETCNPMDKAQLEFLISIKDQEFTYQAIEPGSCLRHDSLHSFRRPNDPTSGVSFLSVDHYLAAEKARIFKDRGSFDKIMATDDPKEAIELGRQVLDYDDVTWKKCRYHVAVRSNLSKFRENADCREALLVTGNDILVDTAYGDWGIGGSSLSKPNSWRGDNLHGFAVMEIRTFLRAHPVTD